MIGRLPHSRALSADRERFSVRIIVLAPKPAHNQYYMAGVIAHELGNAFHSHKGKAIRQAIRAAGARLFFLPKYSPDLNPIEQVFAKLKHLLRDAAARLTARPK